MNLFKKTRNLLFVLALGLGSLMAGKAHADSNGRKIYEQTLKGTALIWVKNQNGFVHGGTGWVVDASKRWILTNHHVAKPGVEVRVSFAKRDKGKLLTETEHYTANEAIPGRVLRSDPLRDVALIELERLPEGVRQLALADESAQAGDQLFSVGNPAVSSGFFVLSKGNVRTVLRKTMNYPDQNLICRMVESDLAANPGDSGSPVVNEDGKVIGIHSGGNSQARGIMSWQIDVSEIRHFLANPPRGELVFEKAGQLTTTDAKTLISGDPKAPDKKESHHQVFTVELQAGTTYVIDLASGDFDAYLLLEDAAGKKLMVNDDGGIGRNARIAIRPRQAGTFRIIATSFDGKVGAFTLTVRKDQ